MPTPKKITIGIFKAIKRLQADGAKVKEVMEYFNVSEATARRCFNCETFDEYENETVVRSKQIKAAKAKEKNEPQPMPAQQEVIHKHEQSVTLIANHYMAEQLQKQSNLLTIISNKLAFIVDELCGTTVKKEE
jgi:DeoR/GlpR family transcriptional regulator of sugar metabolism